MATIQNDRDVLLQAAPTRFVPPPLPQEVQDAVDAIKGVTVTATANMFHISASGSATPSSITLTATLKLISGAVVWSVVHGSATIAWSGTTCTLSAASMASDLVVIRASVTAGSIVYYDDFTVTKAVDGARGTRGTVSLSTSVGSAAWSDAVANSLVASFTGSSVLVPGDTVTQTNATAGWAQTRYWTGSAWQFQTQVIDGNLVVTGTLSVAKLTSGEMTALSGQGVLGIGQSATILRLRRPGSGTGDPGNYTAPLLSIWDSHSGIQDVWPLTVYGQYRPRTADFTGVSGGNSWGFTHPVVNVQAAGVGGSIAVALNVTVGGTIAATTVAAQITNNRTSTQANIAGPGYAFNAVSGGYLPFTGIHEGAIEPASTAERGDIVCDVQTLEASSIIDTFHLVAPSTCAGQRGAVGVITQIREFDRHVPAAYRWDGFTDDGPVYDPAFDAVREAYKWVLFAGVGEGQINVCGRGGDIARGDLIECSDMPGKGQRQADDVVRASTVARAREDVHFDGPDDVRLVPCIYLCG